MTSRPDVIAALLADPGSALLAIDFDGTLAPIVARPEDARPAEGAREVLAALAERLGAVAIVSGRAAEEVVATCRRRRCPETSGARALRLTALA